MTTDNFCLDIKEKNDFLSAIRNQQVWVTLSLKQEQDLNVAALMNCETPVKFEVLEKDKIESSEETIKQIIKILKHGKSTRAKIRGKGHITQCSFDSVKVVWEIHLRVDHLVVDHLVVQ